MRVNYPLRWRLLKPSRLLVGLQLADGTRKNTLVIVEPNRTYNLWIYPWRDANLKNYFSPAESAWRASGARPPVEKVWITPYRLDHYSVDPADISVDRMQAVGLSLAQGAGKSASVGR